ncbi:hypothetical protein HD806DRAFT_545426 [Xylariaceae sp. AK1471]|nr:hypothetical protein HD806DRAFT_545426 [Xylariaceae sp. AK1471]
MPLIYGEGRGTSNFFAVLLGIGGQLWTTVVPVLREEHRVMDLQEILNIEEEETLVGHYMTKKQLDLALEQEDMNRFPKRSHYDARRILETMACPLEQTQL